MHLLGVRYLEEGLSSLQLEDIGYHSHRDVVFNKLSRGYDCAKEKRLVQVENFTEEPEAPEPKEDFDKVESDDNSKEPEGGQEDPRELETDDRKGRGPKRTGEG